MTDKKYTLSGTKSGRSSAKGINILTIEEAKALPPNPHVTVTHGVPPVTVTYGGEIQVSGLCPRAPSDFYEQLPASKMTHENYTRILEDAELSENDRLHRGFTAVMELSASKLAAARYPLWCVDSGEIDNPQRYKLHKSHDEAQASLPDEPPTATVRRCRRVRASEVPFDADQKIVEAMDESLGQGNLPAEEVWGVWGKVLTSSKSDTLHASFKMWLDANVQVDLFVCEGDE